MPDPVRDLFDYIDRSPTPYHAVAETARRLAASGFQELSETQAWDLSPGDRRYVVRGHGSLLAFSVGALAPVAGGFRVVAAHTDSPNLRIKPLPDLSQHGYRALAVESYGSVLLHTWLDRDLSLAGRAVLRDGDTTRTALLGAVDGAADFTRVLVLYDREEVGSRTSQGAAGTLLQESLQRIGDACEGGSAQGLPRALARSLLISADMAHAVHPNYADRHEPGHRPVIGRGPVIESSAGQSYAGDARAVGLFRDLCARIGIEPQHFASRNDIPCGSTVGPISAARVGLPTVDVGNPMLSMHSCREMAGAADVAPMISVPRLFLEGGSGT